MQQKELLYQGKAKNVYATDQEGVLIVEYRDDVTAFNGIRKESLTDKGLVNSAINSFLMQQLAKAGIPTHFIKALESGRSAVKALDMLPIECVMRNRAAGSICKRLGLERGKVLDALLFEFFLKNDELNDPLVTDDHILAFNWATQDQITGMRELTAKINAVLTPLFAAANLILVDYKLEFGMHDGQLVLGDEISPDSCRLWDADTLDSLDKDVFREEKGDLVSGYKEVAKRLNIQLAA